jgi:hypothetical protein
MSPSMIGLLIFNPARLLRSTRATAMPATLNAGQSSLLHMCGSSPEPECCCAAAELGRTLCVSCARPSVLAFRMAKPGPQQAKYKPAAIIKNQLV